MSIRDKFMYTYQKELANDVSTWECVLRRKGQCKARVHLSAGGEFLRIVNKHTHPSVPTQFEITKVRAGIKRRADTTQDKTQQILAAEMQGVSESAAVNMPSLDNIRRNIRYQRQDNPLPNPLHRNDIPAILTHEYQVTSMEEPFLLLDSGVDDPERFFIFGTNRGLQLLGQSQHWYADGTFKVCPQVFFQVYTIHAQVNGQVLPCVFSLLPNKVERTYDYFRRLLT